jgi:hypothetical protein
MHFPEPTRCQHFVLLDGTTVGFLIIIQSFESVHRLYVPLFEVMLDMY